MALVSGLDWHAIQGQVVVASVIRECECGLQARRDIKGKVEAFSRGLSGHGDETILGYHFALR